ncbi:MAG: SurA N-terminal domain-containing protein [Balneolaceae bacterium]
MGTMEKMRNSTPIILWVLIFSFGILWVLQDTQVFDAMAVGPQYLGSVNGDRIGLDEFNSRVSYYTDQYNQQTNAPIPADMRANFEEQAWEDLIAERLMSQEMDRLGISVSDEELISMVTGDNPDPFIRQQFQDESGNIDQIALRAAIEAPENREVWMVIEQQLRQNRRQQKMSNFILSGLRISSSDIDQEYRNQNSFADVSFVRFPYGEISDDELTVTDEELRTYYDQNEQQFFRDQTWQFSYISFDKTPTAEDTLRTVQDVEELIPQFEDAEDHAAFLQRVDSSIPFQDTFTAIEDIREEYQVVTDLEVGEVSDAFMVNGQPHVIKKVEQDGDQIKFALLSFRVIADPIATVDRLADEAEEFVYFANSDGFEAEAENQGFEIRQATATKGSPVIPGLGNAAAVVRELEQMSRNGISEAIELADQFVVVQLRETVAAGPRPFEDVRPQIESAVRDQKRKEMMVQQVSSLMSDNQGLGALAEAAGREVQSATSVRMGSNTLANAGREPEIIGSMFTLEEGSESGILEGDQAVFVLRVENLDLADPATMSSEERRQIREELEQEKFGMYTSTWLERLKEEATIRDNRSILLGR